jgi:hypothetical protein
MEMEQVSNQKVNPIYKGQFDLIWKTISKSDNSYQFSIVGGRVASQRVNQHPPAHHPLDAHYDSRYILHLVDQM